jgi:hypothetical protein
MEFETQEWWARLPRVLWTSVSALPFDSLRGGRAELVRRPVRSVHASPCSLRELLAKVLLVWQSVRGCRVIGIETRYRPGRAELNFLENGVSAKNALRNPSHSKGDFQAY